MCLFGWVCVAGRGLSLAAANGGYSPAVVCGRLLAVPPLVAEYGLWALRLQ